MGHARRRAETVAARHPDASANTGCGMPIAARCCSTTSIAFAACEVIHLCDACDGKPCLKACPVGAYSAAGFAHRTALRMCAARAGACRDGGCLDRNACPYGTAYRYPRSAGVPYGGFRALTSGTVMRLRGSRRCVQEQSNCRSRVRIALYRDRRTGKQEAATMEARHRDQDRGRRRQGRAFPGRGGRGAGRRHPLHGCVRPAAGARWHGRAACAGRAMRCWCPISSIATAPTGRSTPRPPSAKRRRVPQLMALVGGTTPGDDASRHGAFLDALAADRRRPGRSAPSAIAWAAAGRSTRPPPIPDRIAAAASFHGGNLASDAPDSPHRNAADIKARVYVGRPASTAASRRNSRPGWPRRCGRPRSTTSSRTMSAWRMAGRAGPQRLRRGRRRAPLEAADELFRRGVWIAQMIDGGRSRQNLNRRSDRSLL